MLFSDVMFSGLVGAPWQIRLFSVPADKGYDSAAIRCHLKSKDIVPCISVQEGHQAVRGQFVQKVWLDSICCGKILWMAEERVSQDKNTLREKIYNCLGFVYLASDLMYLKVLG